MDTNSRIFVAGHRGLVGSNLCLALEARGFTNIITRTRAELDLLEQDQVRSFFARERIDYVFVCAAKVGGILFNKTHQADFLYENMMISANLMKAAADHGVAKLLYLGSSCIYPKHAPQPISESSLLTGPLEPTNEGYALAKIAGLKLCEKFSEQYGKRFVSVMPTNLYGPGDNFHPEHSHVIPALIRRFHEAKINRSPVVEIWGTGNARREFLFVRDLAEALLTVMLNYEERETINVGTGEDITIRELAETIKEVVGYQGEITFDHSKPDGTPRKVLDVSKINRLGWRPQVTLREGLNQAYEWGAQRFSGKTS